MSLLASGLALALTATSLGSRQVSAGDAAASTAIRAVLDEQQAAWNRGDVTAFMKGYWNSPDLTFAGSSGITRGWEPVTARYRKNYPDAAAMGHLDFSDIEIRELGSNASLVLGRWRLKRANDAPGGVFTLVFERFPEGWRIIHDHTSADSKP
jgi:ketosteroid isomerase-like protein